MPNENGTSIYKLRRNTTITGHFNATQCLCEPVNIRRSRTRREQALPSFSKSGLKVATAQQEVTLWNCGQLPNLSTTPCHAIGKQLELGSPKRQAWCSLCSLRLFVEVCWSLLSIAVTHFPAVWGHIIEILPMITEQKSSTSMEDDGRELWSSHDPMNRPYSNRKNVQYITIPCQAQRLLLSKCWIYQAFLSSPAWNPSYHLIWLRFFNTNIPQLIPSIPRSRLTRHQIRNGAANQQTCHECRPPAMGDPFHGRLWICCCAWWPGALQRPLDGQDGEDSKTMKLANRVKDVNQNCSWKQLFLRKRLCCPPNFANPIEASLQTCLDDGGWTWHRLKHRGPQIWMRNMRNLFILFKATRETMFICLGSIILTTSSVSSIPWGVVLWICQGHQP